MLDWKAFWKIVLIFAAVGFISIAVSNVIGRSVCLIWEVVGVPCPSCGTTRAVRAFFSGNIKESFRYHPFWLWVAVIPVLQLIKKTPKKVYIFLAFLYVGLWVWRMVIYFPHTSPMTFNSSALVPSIIKLLQAF